MNTNGLKTYIIYKGPKTLHLWGLKPCSTEEFVQDSGIQSLALMIYGLWVKPTALSARTPHAATIYNPPSHFQKTKAAHGPKQGPRFTRKLRLWTVCQNLRTWVKSFIFEKKTEQMLYYGVDFVSPCLPFVLALEHIQFEARSCSP